MRYEHLRGIFKMNVVYVDIPRPVHDAVYIQQDDRIRLRCRQRHDNIVFTTGDAVYRIVRNFFLKAEPDQTTVYLSFEQILVRLKDFRRNDGIVYGFDYYFIRVLS